MAEISVIDEGQVAEKEESGPHVYGLENYESDKVPYAVEIDQGKWRELLSELGMDKKDISEASIFAERKSLLASLMFKRRRNESVRGLSMANSLSIYTDWSWKAFEKYSKLAQEISEGNLMPDAEQFSKLLTTRRLANYLRVAKPTVERPDRGVTFADELILGAVNKELRKTAIHEAEHVVSYVKGEQGESEKANMQGVMGGVGGVVGAISPIMIDMVASNPVTDHWSSMVAGAVIGFTAGARAGYRMDSGEKAANQASRKFENRPDYVNLIRMKPKVQAPAPNVTK